MVSGTGGLDVAIVHDYLTQTGGAERVVLSMLKAFPDAPVYTSLYHPERTFPAFRAVDVRPMPALNRFALLRRYHRLGLPVYGPAFERTRIHADVVLCSSSGWAHLVAVDGLKVVYCYTPARWLYQQDAYLRRGGRAQYAAIKVLAPHLIVRDQRLASTADAYLTSSSVVRERISSIYGRDAEVIPPPASLLGDGPERAVDVEPGYYLVVSRLLPYKNVDAVMTATMSTGRRLVIVGEGPDRRRLQEASDGSVSFVGRVADDELRWLYRNAKAAISVSYEDFGLVPLEANWFLRPVVALRWGGFLDTVVDGETGILCDEPHPKRIAAALDELEACSFDGPRLRAHAEGYSEDGFVRRLRAMVGELAAARGRVAS